MCRHVASAIARRFTQSLQFVPLALLSSAAIVMCSDGAQAAKNKSSTEPIPSVSLGRELFVHRWTPGDARSRNGDGLGPMFNERSCVACHSQGGIGGGGPEKHNVQVISVAKPKRPSYDDLCGKQRNNDTEPVAASSIHPGLALDKTVVLHRFSLVQGYDVWRSDRLGLASDRRTQTQCLPRSTRVAGLRKFDSKLPVEECFASLQAGSQTGDNRTTALQELNPPPLFGMGLIDALPNRAFEIALNRSADRVAQTQGRIARLPDGRIGRFGWKANKATLAEFTAQACAVELGLECPTHPQSSDPLNINAAAPGIDLNKYDCDSLTAYVHDLPRPEQTDVKEMESAERDGRRLFASIGCADCHQPNMGKIVGIYSDLLLHNMGGTATANGYGSTIRTLAAKCETLANRGQRPALEVGETEWRTPPLWGCATSGPYWHDGRATTLEIAIALHGGQSLASSVKFKELRAPAQHNLIAFLKTMRAPQAEPVPSEEDQRSRDRIASRDPDPHFGVTWRPSVATAPNGTR